MQNSVYRERARMPDILSRFDAHLNRSETQRRNVLVFEPENLTRKLMHKMLSEADFNVEPVTSPNDILEKLRSNQYDLTILSPSANLENCIALCKAIRKEYSEWEMPVIMVVEDSNLNNPNICINAGASDIVLKPLKWPLLVSRLNSALKLKKYNLALKLKEHRLKKAQAMARIGYWTMKGDPTNVYFSDEFCNILDITPGSICTFSDIFNAVHPDDQESFISQIQEAFLNEHPFSFSHRIKMPNGQEFFVTQIGEFSVDSNSNYEKEFFVAMRDETEIYFARERLHQERFYDQITLLPNRAYFQDMASAMLQDAENKERMLTCIFIGIDSFRDFNDALGHVAGDFILSEISKRLELLSSNHVKLSRYGSDIFAMLSEDFQSIDECEAYAESVHRECNKTIHYSGHTILPKVSIGFSFYPFDAESTDELLSAADTAMNSAKKEDGNCTRFHTNKMTKKIRYEVKLESQLKAAIENGELELYYQPQVASNGSRITGMESLIRWNHPSQGLIPPFDFMDLAEQRGLIIPMGEWIMQRACTDGANLHQQGHSDLRIGINLSAKQFNDFNFLKKIQDAINYSSVDPSTLELEVTESSAMHDVNTTIRLLHAIHEMGAHTSMDDFGTGHSSLSNLQLLPLDTLKIDRAFVKDIGQRENAGAIASAIITMAKGLKMETIAEGVETEQQLQFMRTLQCDIIQGFYYSKPLPFDDLKRYLESYTPH